MRFVIKRKKNAHKKKKNIFKDKYEQKKARVQRIDNSRK